MLRKLETFVLWLISAPISSHGLRNDLYAAERNLYRMTLKRDALNYEVMKLQSQVNIINKAYQQALVLEEVD